MLNIIELEKKWFIYKLKSFIPYIIGIFSILIIFIAILNFKYSSENKESNIYKANTKKTENTKTSKETYIKTNHKSNMKELIEEKIVITPSLKFMEDFENNIPLKENNIIPKSRPKIVQNKKIVETVLDIQEPKIEKKQAVDANINKIDIKRQNTNEDIQHVIKRFNKNNSPALSLFIAKKYYELNDYKKAYQYAFITNQINDEIEESWIIFTKSMLKLGQKNKAIETLKRYINHSHSAQAKILLEDITSGRFK